MSKKKVVIGFSGGMDSTTLLAFMLNMEYDVYCCFFDYGSKHGLYEYKAACAIYQYYMSKSKDVGGSLTFRKLDMIEIFNGFDSSLLKSGGRIPEGHYEDDSMKVTKVPGRNMIFASIMAGFAESIGAVSVALGVHAGDYVIYPDCRLSFISALSLTMYLSSDEKIVVQTPFIDMCKKEILELGYSFNVPVPYNLTRTCYKDQELSCGKCGSCQERSEAYAQIGIIDPLRAMKQ